MWRFSCERKPRKPRGRQQTRFLLASMIQESASLPCRQAARWQADVEVDQGSPLPKILFRAYCRWLRLVFWPVVVPLADYHSAVLAAAWRQERPISCRESPCQYVYGYQGRRSPVAAPLADYPAWT